ncbi:MAG TPA: hypothetical protein ENN43_04530 [bacterium]|nr:hypothetical protein [bacterium]
MMRNFYTRVLIITFLLAVIIFMTGRAIGAYRHHNPWVKFEATVTEVIDGDTVRISGSKRSVRLLGIDAPETNHPDFPQQRYGVESKRYLETMIKGKKVILEYNKREPFDIYNRILAYIYTAEGTMVNAEMVKTGHAYVYEKKQCSRVKELLVLENIARQLKKGIWKHDIGGREKR